MKIETDDTNTLELARAGVFAQVTQQTEVGEIKCSTAFAATNVVYRPSHTLSGCATHPDYIFPPFS